MEQRTSMKEYLLGSDEVLKNLNSNANGLTDTEAVKRLSEWGRNELDEQKKKGLVRRFIDQLLNPMIIVLLIAASISFILAFLEGDSHGYAEAAIILAVVILNSILGVFQESKAEKAIEALQKMSAASAKVRRGGIISQIPASELVAGDIVLIEAGDAVPADIRLIQSASLQIEEAALTGESVPSEKDAAVLTADESGDISLGDRKNMAYMSSIVTYGRGEGIVCATGMKTEVGKIAGIIQSTAEGETPLQKRLSKLSKILSVIVLFICVVVFAIGLVNAEGQLTARVVQDSFMLAVALAVAAIPEGLAAVVTIVLSIGVTNMARRNAIVRKLPAVETLGCTQVICSDKTGTLTQNKMTVVDNYGDAQLLAQSMYFCNAVEEGADGTLVGDPTQIAQKVFGIKYKPFPEDRPRLGEIPFESARKMMTTLHSSSDGKIWQFTNGAPDVVLSKCSQIIINGETVALTDEMRDEVLAENTRMAGNALRVLCGAFKLYDEYPSALKHEIIEQEMTFIGLVGMIDPIRPEVLEAVENCKTSGIKVVMITGDHKETAAAIAKELGIIENIDQAVTGRELDGISDEEFEERVGNIFVYARVQPDHKVRIVNMWKKKGFITAMTGDGVNDAPAIKSGDIGIGMGITGTDVTKNVADMVLADDNFATIVVAVGEGRRIYDNIRKTLQFLLSTNLSEVIAILIATLMGFTLFKPIHLLFINLVTDTVPAVALGMEHAEEGIMKRPPRGEKAGIFSDKLGINIIYQGLLIAGLTLAGYFIIFYIRSQSTMDYELVRRYAMTSAFFTLSMCEICQAFTMRSIKHSIFTLKTPRNNVLWGAMLFSLTAAFIVIYIPPVANVFSLEPLSFIELLISIGLAVVVIPIIEAVKMAQRGFDEKKMTKIVN